MVPQAGIHEKVAAAAQPANARFRMTARVAIAR